MPDIYSKYKASKLRLSAMNQQGFDASSRTSVATNHFRHESLKKVNKVYV